MVLRSSSHLSEYTTFHKTFFASRGSEFCQQKAKAVICNTHLAIQQELSKNLVYIINSVAWKKKSRSNVSEFISMLVKKKEQSLYLTQSNFHIRGTL